METTFEITKLINLSPKRNAAFDLIKADPPKKSLALELVLQPFVLLGGLSEPKEEVWSILELVLELLVLLGGLSEAMQLKVSLRTIRF